MRVINFKLRIYQKITSHKSFINTNLIAVCFSLVISGNVAALSDKTKPKGSAEPMQAILECDEECVEKVNRLKKFARNGSPEAQTLLAISYRTGEMTEVDSKRAWKLIKFAIRLRYAPALHIVSQWHREGFETAIDIQKANEYLERAAKQGFSPAVYDLAILNYDQKNFQKSIELFETAAKLGNPDAKRVMSKLSTYLKNASVSQDSEQPTETQPEEHGDDNNVLTIVGSQEAPIMLFENFFSELKDLKIYNRRAVTGSRLGFRKCGEPGTGCNVMFSRSSDSVELMDVNVN
ncbi:MAG: hypothetical protein OQK04_19590 [Kangiellaceae bacterium]|nr:hypothetical protein [Kangiellaceae bacterium]